MCQGMTPGLLPLQQGVELGEIIRFVLDVFTVTENGVYVQVMTVTPMGKQLKRSNGMGAIKTETYIN